VVKPRFSLLLVPSACALALGLTLIVHTHHAVAQTPLSNALAPPARPIFEHPILAEDGAFYGSVYWGWSNGSYLWIAGNWSSAVGLSGGLAHFFEYPGEELSGGHGQDPRFYYHTTVSQVSSNGNVVGDRTRPSILGKKIPVKGVAGLEARGAI
jgi:hypothetical protein